MKAIESALDKHANHFIFKKMLKVTKIQIGRGDTRHKGRLTDLVNVFERFCSIHVYLYLSIHSCFRFVAKAYRLKMYFSGSYCNIH